jgi:hypothetical protein
MLIPDARVLRVIRDGASTSIVVQIAHSNTVLKCCVDWDRSQRNVRVDHLREGRLVTLRLLSCCPPQVVVGVSIVLSEQEEETVGEENYKRWQCAFSKRCPPAERRALEPPSFPAYDGLRCQTDSPSRQTDSPRRQTETPRRQRSCFFHVEGGGTDEQPLRACTNGPSPGHH